MSLDENKGRCICAGKRWIPPLSSAALQIQSDHNFTKVKGQGFLQINPILFSLSNFLPPNPTKNERRQPKTRPQGLGSDLQEAEAHTQRRRGTRLKVRLQSLHRRRQTPRLAPHFRIRKSKIRTQVLSPESLLIKFCPKLTSISFSF